MSIVANVGVLAVFKYFNFLNSNIHAIAEVFHWPYGIAPLNIILPIGLSFHTFQAMSYTIEVYYGRQKAERHLGIYALYVMFFPQLVAGPIERPQNMLPQFHSDKHLDPWRVRDGLKQILWGLFKKACIADLLAPVVSTVYAAPRQYTGGILWVATVFFTIQIYCDFSGYSDIAIGTARILGYDLMTNFRQPYFARSIREFWSRWHISLSTWFRDYVYIPLGGSRVSRPRHYFNLLFVFALSGLWHGAAWTFVIWGLLHGSYLVLGHMLAPLRARLHEVLRLERFPRLVSAAQIVFIWLLVAIGWVFFRAASATDAFHVLGQLVRPTPVHVAELAQLGLPRFEVIIAALMIGVLFLVDRVLIAPPPSLLALWQRTWFRWGCLTACTYAIVFFGVFAKLEFIYFQF